MIFHWGFEIIFIYGIFKQVDDINQLSDISLLKFEIIFAALMLILLIMRYLYMSQTQVTSLPEDTSMFQRRAAKIVHISLYINLSNNTYNWFSDRTFILVGFEKWYIY